MDFLIFSIVIMLVLVALFWGGIVLVFLRASDNPKVTLVATLTLQATAALFLVALATEETILALLILVFPPIGLFYFIDLNSLYGTQSFMGPMQYGAAASAVWITICLLNSWLRRFVSILGGVFIFSITTIALGEEYSKHAMCVEANKLGVSNFYRTPLMPSVTEKRTGHTSIVHASFVVEDQTFYIWSYYKGTFVDASDRKDLNLFANNTEC